MLLSLTLFILLTRSECLQWSIDILGVLIISWGAGGEVSDWLLCFAEELRYTVLPMLRKQNKIWALAISKYYFNDSKIFCWSCQWLETRQIIYWLLPICLGYYIIQDKKEDFRERFSLCILGLMFMCSAPAWVSMTSAGHSGPCLEISTVCHSYHFCPFSHLPRPLLLSF